jgi:hypothetical protein
MLEFVFIVVGLNPVGSAIDTVGFATLTSSLQSTKVALMMKNQAQFMSFPTIKHIYLKESFTFKE